MKCPACAGEARLLVEGRLLPAGLGVFQCGECELDFFEEALDDDYWSVPAQNEIYSDGAVAEERSAFFERVLDEIGSLVQPGELLDVGAGKGEFARLAVRRGWRASVVEPSSEVTRGLESDGIARVFNCAFEDHTGDDAYDCITFLDILEHTKNPKALISKAVSHLRSNGILVVLTPDGGSLLRRSFIGLSRLSSRLSGLLKYQYYLPHVSYLSAPTLRRYAAECGLEVACLRHKATPRLFLENKLEAHYDKYTGNSLVRQVVAAVYPLAARLFPNKLFAVLRKVC